MASFLVAMLALAAAVQCATAFEQRQHHPDIVAAQHNAFALFNSIHSAMRQWGSSVNHNGMSFYLAQAPKGSVFYHGGYTDTRPISFEWLAFEIEHSASFAQSWEGWPPSDQNETSSEFFVGANLDQVTLWRQSFRYQVLREAAGASPLLDQSESAQQHLSSHTAEEGEHGGNGNVPGNPPDLGGVFRGYFHTYRANRPLNLVYIDGEGAAKCALGSMDSQDLVLLGWNRTVEAPRKQMAAEAQRASELCALADDWSSSQGDKIDGFVRMEAGFEIIYCDFSPMGGLDLINVQASPFKNESHIDESPDPLYHQRFRSFQWFQAAASRFRGHPAGRLTVDWSSMVSAFFYPVNLSNPDVTRQDLPRLLSTTVEERSSLRSRLRDVIRARSGSQAGKKQIIGWQSIVDEIVTRYSQRLDMIVKQDLIANQFLMVISTLVDPFIDYLDKSPMAERFAAKRCTQHYLQPPPLQSEDWTPEDYAIFAAIETVSGDICTSLFTARRLLIDSMLVAGNQSVVEQARNIAWELVEKLGWSTWRECGGCAANEICSIPMFPMGTVDDYNHPTCKNMSQLDTGYFGRWV